MPISDHSHVVDAALVPGASAEVLTPRLTLGMRAPYPGLSQGQGPHMAQVLAHRHRQLRVGVRSFGVVGVPKDHLEQADTSAEMQVPFRRRIDGAWALTCIRNTRTGQEQQSVPPAG
jgi:hypothetical protein